MQPTLETVRADIIASLEQAASDRRSAMHAPVVSTADGDLRIMVLRGFDSERWTLRFHTDRRAPKVAVFEHDESAGVLFYDREKQLQIRIAGRARIEVDSALADRAWRDSDAYARRCYLGHPPGRPVDAPTSGLPVNVEGKRPSEVELAPARANFAVLLVEVETADWYHLAHGGHRRAMVRPDGSGQWLTP